MAAPLSTRTRARLKAFDTNLLARILMRDATSSHNLDSASPALLVRGSTS